MKKFIRKGLLGISVIATPNEKTRNKLGEWFLKGLGVMGKVMTSPITLSIPTTATTAATTYQTKELIDRKRLIDLQSEELLGKAMTWISPLNYGAALYNGHGLNAHKGEQEVSSWSPFWQAVGRGTELYVGPKVVKGVKKAPSIIDEGLARTGSTSAKGRVVARELNKGIKENTKNGRIEVGPEYFKAEDKWYRITEKPEKLGIEELGKNITTHDDIEMPGTINGWRVSMLDNGMVNGTGINEGYFIRKPRGIKIQLRFGHGRAHGNTSQAAKGLLWQANTAGSGIFPRGIIEGQAPVEIPYGLSRTNFVKTPWEDVPTGRRIGFHTGEMPMENLGWFQETSNGKYTYEPIIPEKRITYDPNRKFRLLGSLPRAIDSKTYPMYRGPRFSISSVVNPDGTVNPRQAMRVQHTVAELFPGAYKMEHRLENSRWHKNDPTTYHHTRNAALSAWRIGTPFGFTKQDQMVAALGHDFGKMISGSGHAQIGADLARLVFPDLTDAQYTAIAEHMGLPNTPLGKVTKLADINNGRSYVTDKKGNRLLIAQHNLWASQYGYPTLPYSLASSNVRTNKAVRNTIARHNSFYRGINPKMATLQDKLNYKASLKEGEQPTVQGFIRFASITPRSEGAGIFVSPFSANSSIYGNGTTNLVRRPYKLGKDRMNWFKEGDFEVLSIYDSGKDLSGHPVVNPWEVIRLPFTPKPNNGTVPANELVLFNNLHYVGPRSYKATGETTNKTNVTLIHKEGGKL